MYFLSVFNFFSNKKEWRQLASTLFLRPYNLMCKDEQFLKVNQNWV